VRRSAPCLGKWTTISGSYEGVAESLLQDSFHVSLTLDNGRRVNLRFALADGDQLRRLKAGQRITAISQIPVFGATFIPENCGMVRAEPLTPRGRTALAYAS
jgi:hypothetical protein